MKYYAALVLTIGCFGIGHALPSPGHDAPQRFAVRAPAPVELVATGVVAEDVAIYVDPSGHALSTVTSFYTQVEQPVIPPATSISSTSRASIAVVPIRSSAPPVAAGNHAVPVSAVAATQHPSSAAAPKPASTKTAAAPATSTGTAFHLGITYSPYLGGGGCKSASQVAADVAKLGAYDVIRLYDIDCNGLAHVLAAAPARTRVFAGISRISNVPADLASLAAQVGGHWPRIHTVAIGNELVNSGAAAAAAVAAAIGQARPQLRAAGFAGPVVTVDTAVATVHNPVLGQASDYSAVNAHAFFDPNTRPQDAGAFVQGWVRQVQAAVPGKAVVVTESGWPSAGSANGEAVPSEGNQQAAVASLKAAFGEGGLVLFTAFNDLWKKNTALTFGAEQYWGILGNSPSG